MDEHTRNQINSFLNSSSSKLISNLIKSLEDKTLDLSSSTIAIKKDYLGQKFYQSKKF